MLSAKLLGLYSPDPTLLPELGLTDFPQLNSSPKELEPNNFVLVLNDLGLSLQATGKSTTGPVQVDFVKGAAAHRRLYGGGKGQMIAKAIGIKGNFRPYVVDVTAGLGQDGFVLATLGCSVTLVERMGFVYHLLCDGLHRAINADDAALNAIAQRIKVEHDDGVNYLQALADAPDVIYMDPMFPARSKTAAVNKQMQAFHQLVGEDLDAGDLLVKALNKAKYRVVVKRPRKAPQVGEQYPDLSLPKPSLVFEGKSTRFDVYPIKKMPA